MLDTKLQVDQLTDKEAFVLGLLYDSKKLTEKEIHQRCKAFLLFETTGSLLTSLENMRYIEASDPQKPAPVFVNEHWTYSLTPLGARALRGWQEQAAYFAVARFPDNPNTKGLAILLMKLFKRLNVIFLGAILTYSVITFVGSGPRALVLLTIPILIPSCTAFILSQIDHIMFWLYNFVLRNSLIDERRRLDPS